MLQFWISLGLIHYKFNHAFKILHLCLIVSAREVELAELMMLLILDRYMLIQLL